MECVNCHADVNSLVYYKDHIEWCWNCHNATKGGSNQSAMIATDSIPGGLEIKHGLCWPDGSPRRFDSKSDIKRAAYENGWTIGGDTPKPNPRLQERRALENSRRNK